MVARRAYRYDPITTLIQHPPDHGTHLKEISEEETVLLLRLVVSRVTYHVTLGCIVPSYVTSSHSVSCLGFIQGGVQQGVSKSVIRWPQAFALQAATPETVIRPLQGWLPAGPVEWSAMADPSDVVWIFHGPPLKYPLGFIANRRFPCYFRSVSFF
jgi:hypothetical protein